MNKTSALELKPGEIVLDFTGNKCVVESKRIVFDDYDIADVFITIIDTQMNKIEYSSADISRSGVYISEEGVCF